jgi:hypothetical protein
MILLDEPSFHPATIEHMLGAIHQAATEAPATEAPASPPNPVGRGACSPPNHGWSPSEIADLTLDQISCRWPKISQPRAGPKQAAG